MSVYSEYTPPSSGAFLKIEPGQTVKLQLATEPYIFNNDYQGNISQRYAWVVWNFDEAEAQILQLSVTSFRQLKALAEDEDYGDPETYPIKITREGSGTDTKYMITPSPKPAPLSTEAKAACDELVLKDKIKNAIALSSVLKGQQVPPAEESEPLPEPQGDGYEAAKATADRLKSGAQMATEEKIATGDITDDGEINLDDIPF